MGYDLGAAALMSQAAAKSMIDEMLYGKPEPKRKSRFKALFTKLKK